MSEGVHICSRPEAQEAAKKAIDFCNSRTSWDEKSLEKRRSMNEQLRNQYGCTCEAKGISTCKKY